MSPHDCPSREALSRYAAGDLSAGDANTINVHLGQCTVCLGRLDQLSADPDELIDALRKPVSRGSEPNPALAGAVKAVLAGFDLSVARGTALEADTIVDGYRIVAEIGRGGMGHVYRAMHPRLNQEVALKILRPGIEADEGQVRFNTELHALTLMDHPHVARVLDGGTTEDGRPYFVMELVRGAALTHYCDEQRLTLRQRLELFIGICQAVQHAHQKGIIHRDLKPSNVLVAEYGGRPAPKVIDFGVAKAVNRGAGQTEVGMIIGTLEYMSPEQADLRGLDIDTRSDVYSLGVILYELLTGQTPAGGRSRQIPIVELLRILSEVQPAAPSAALSRSEFADEIAGCRSAEPGRLVKEIRGELDWIVLKALEKDRTRRYQTPSALAEDVQRYLNHEPVSAGPPSRAYRVRKFVRRNRALVAAASLLALTLLGGILGTSSALVYAYHEWSRAESALIEVETEQGKTNAALTQKNIALTDLEKEQGKTNAALTQKNSALLDLKDEQGKTKAVVKQAMGALRSLRDDVVERQLFQRTHLTEDDRRFLRDIQKQYEAFSGLPGDDVEWRAVRAEGRGSLGLIRFRLGETKEAEADYRAAIAFYERLVADAPTTYEYRRELAFTHQQLGMLLSGQGRDQAALGEHEAAFKLRKQLIADFPERGEPHKDLAAGQNTLGILLLKMGQLKESERALLSSVDTLKGLAAKFPEEPRYRHALVESYVSLATLYRRSGKEKNAVDTYAEALPVQRKLLTDLPHPESVRVLASINNNLGNLHRGAKHWQDAEDALDESLKLRKQLAADYGSVPDYRSELANTHNGLALLYRDRRRFKDAEKAHKEARALRARLVAEFPGRIDYRIDVAQSHNNLGVLYLNLNRPKDAETAFEEALPVRRKVVEDFPNIPENSNNLAGTLVNLANLSNSRSDFAAARRWLNEGEPHHRDALKLNPDNPLYRDFYRKHLLARTRSNAGLNDRAGAFTAAGKIRDLGWDAPRDAYDAARALVSCIAILEKGHLEGSPELPKEIQVYTDETIALLRTAVTHGFRDGSRLADDAAFTPLRQNPEFKQLLADLAASRP